MMTTTTLCWLKKFWGPRSRENTSVLQWAAEPTTELKLRCLEWQGRWIRWCTMWWRWHSSNRWRIHSTSCADVAWVSSMWRAEVGVMHERCLVGTSGWNATVPAHQGTLVLVLPFFFFFLFFCYLQCLQDNTQAPMIETPQGDHWPQVWNQYLQDYVTLQCLVLKELWLQKQILDSQILITNEITVDQTPTLIKHHQNLLAAADVK